MSCFVLITNLDQGYSTPEILKKYKAQCKVKSHKPTAKIILESVETIMTMTTSDPSRRAFSKRFKVPRVIELAGFAPDIYLDVKERKDYFHKLTTEFL